VPLQEESDVAVADLEPGPGRVADVAANYESLSRDRGGRRRSVHAMGAPSSR